MRRKNAGSLRQRRDGSKAKKSDGRAGKTPGVKAGRQRRGIISPRDERGVPYPGDWPNPLGEKNRGCF